MSKNYMIKKMLNFSIVLAFISSALLFSVGAIYDGIGILIFGILTFIFRDKIIELKNK
ncbi:MAG: hypothetical protein OCD76_19305 [Reichenbachiella sp.]